MSISAHWGRQSLTDFQIMRNHWSFVIDLQRSLFWIKNAINHKRMFPILNWDFMAGCWMATELGNSKKKRKELHSILTWKERHFPCETLEWIKMMANLLLAFFSMKVFKFLVQNIFGYQNNFLLTNFSFYAISTQANVYSMYRSRINFLLLI